MVDTNRKLAEQIHEGDCARSILEDRLFEAGVANESGEDLKTGYDNYDNSIELYDLAPSFRLSEDAQKILHAAGFNKAYCNHTDKWETHYTFKPRESFSVSKGWRVSYPHKRGADEKAILLEEVAKTWPTEWFETGKAIVKKSGV